MSLEKIVQNFQSGGKGKGGDDKKDCLSCRLVGGLGCIGIGCYIAAQARSTTSLTYGGLMLFASGFVCLGALRLSSVDVFNSETSSITNKANGKVDDLTAK